MNDKQAARIAGKRDGIKPDHISKTGCRWWADQITSIPPGLQKQGVRCWIAVENNGNATRLITCKSEILYESPSLEDIGCRLNMAEHYPEVLFAGQRESDVAQ